MRLAQEPRLLVEFYKNLEYWQKLSCSSLPNNQFADDFFPHWYIQRIWHQTILQVSEEKIIIFQTIYMYV